MINQQKQSTLVISAMHKNFSNLNESSQIQEMVLPKYNVFAIASHLKSVLSEPLPKDFNPSKLVLDMISSVLNKYIDAEPQIKPERARSILVAAIKKASLELYKAKQKVIWQKSDGDSLNVELDIVWILSNFLILGHVGTGRIYLLRDGVLEQLTTDENYANSMFKENLIPEQEALQRFYANRIAHTLGLEQTVEVETLMPELQQKDRVLLCSSGFYRNNTEQEITNTISNVQSNIEAFKGALTSLTKSSKSNISIILETEGTKFSPKSKPVIIPATKMAAVKNNPFFNLLTFAEQTRLLEISNVKTFKNSEILAKEGDIPETMWIILDSKVEIKKGTTFVAERKFGAVIGESLLIAQEPRIADVRAVGDVKVIEFHKNSLLSLIDGYMNNTAARIFRALSTFLFEKLRELTRKYDLLERENQELRKQHIELLKIIKR